MPLTFRCWLALLLLAVAAATEARPSAWGRHTAAALLPVDEAFQLLPPERQGRRLHIEWNIAPGYYLYQHSLAVELLRPAGKLGKAALPPGIKFHDEHFGDVRVYRGLLSTDLALPAKLKGKLRVRVTYQGCADAGVCYPPQTRELDVQERK